MTVATASVALNVPIINNSFTSSYLTTSSFNTVSSSFVKIVQTSSMNVLSSSYSVTASYALNVGGGGTSVNTASFVTTSSYNSSTGSFTLTSSFKADNTLTVSAIGNTVTTKLNRTPVTVTYSSTASFNPTGSFTLYRIVATGSVLLNKPSSTLDGSNVEIWLTSLGGAYNVALTGSIVVPVSSSFTSPQTIPSGKKAKILLQYDAVLNGGQWELTTFISGY
jgi:hypothetical protein